MKRWLIVLAAVLAALALGILLRKYVAGTVRIAGTSMQETLCGGDIALVTRFNYKDDLPKHGDVVECCFPMRSDTYIKRVIGLPGDVVDFSEGRLTLNGRIVQEAYVSSATEDYSVTLGENEFLVLGDNREESYDSRMEDMGPVGADAFLGRVCWILWPLNRFGPVK